MSRNYYQSGTPFLFTGSEAVGPGMDCLQLRHQPAGPFHYLISEQAKSLVALQELQHEVGALLEFRDLVMETFPNLRTKLASSTPATMTHHHHSNIPVSIRPGDWTPGIRVRKKLGGKEKKSGDVTVQDSGFSTETSSKETHSASSSAAPPSNTAAGVIEIDEAEDELWNLLDVIHRKGTRLKDEVEALQGSIRDQSPLRENGNFQRALFHSSADDVRQLRQERDLLLDRLAEMEAEVIAGRIHTSRLQEDLDNLLSAKNDLEEQLKAIVSQRGEVNSRIHDLHLQFVSKNSADDKVKVVTSDVKKDSSSSQRTNRSRSSSTVSALDLVLGERIPKVVAPDSKKFAAILKEYDPLVLQKHLLTSTVQNQSLQQQLDAAVGLEVGLREKLNKVREENEDLRFQLEDKSIELEGTRARVRLLEELQKPHNITSSPDIIPDLDIAPDRPISRSEITTASMKAMSPLPMNLQMDHSSSTESAHDLTESNRKGSSKRRPSKIPLKSYTAPKPPGGKHSPAPGAPRSRSGDSPHRSHSAHSWRNRSGERSPSLGKDKTSLPKSRNASLVSARDSLSTKLRSSESLVKSTSTGGGGTMKKTSTGTIKWTQKDEKVPNSTQTNGKSQYPWILSSFNSIQATNAGDKQLNYGQETAYPDSLMDHQQGDSSIQKNTDTITDSGSQRFQTANTFLWTTGNEFYDSIDSNLASSCYRSNGEELAECDSLEKRMSDISLEKK